MTTELEAAKIWCTALGRIPALRRLGQHFVGLQSQLRAGCGLSGVFGGYGIR